MIDIHNHQLGVASPAIAALNTEGAFVGGVFVENQRVKQMARERRFAARQTVAHASQGVFPVNRQPGSVGRAIGRFDDYQPHVLPPSLNHPAHKHSNKNPQPKRNPNPISP